MAERGWDLNLGVEPTGQAQGRNRVRQRITNSSGKQNFLNKIIQIPETCSTLAWDYSSWSVGSLRSPVLMTQVYVSQKEKYLLMREEID